MTFNDRIRNAEFVNDISHFYECEACGYKHERRQEVIDHQLGKSAYTPPCDQIGYLEEVKV